jgi:hypothetical protein
MMTKGMRALSIAAVAGAALLAPAPRAQAAMCTMEFSLSGWSAFYKTASGHGTITCSNGQAAHVSLRAKGGGLTVGKSKVTNGRGKFSEVSSIDELFGSYAVAEAHAGMGPSSTAQALTKGTVSLELTGTGQGVDLGFSFGGLTISRSK